MAFQSRLDFVAKSALFRPFHSAIVEDASVDRRAVTARRALERETRATEPARARDRETARTRARRRRRRGSDEGRAGTPTTTRRDARGRARRDGERARDGVWIRKARERADGGDRDARGEGEARTSEDGARGGDASASGRARDASRSERSGNYGSSSHGGHGREMMYDADEARTFGRQHGSTEVLSALTTEEARTIPARAIAVHAGEKSESYVRGEDGELYEMMACGRTRTRAHAPSSPRAVVTVHSSEVNEDAGAIGAAGRRYRGSFNSLLLLEAQELSTGRASSASG
jgi:hypothetical protein